MSPGETTGRPLRLPGEMLIISQPRILSLVLPTSLGHTHPSPHVSLSNPSQLLVIISALSTYTLTDKAQQGDYAYIVGDIQRCLCEPVGAFLHAPSGVGDSPYTGEIRTRAAGRVLT